MGNDDHFYLTKEVFLDRSLVIHWQVYKRGISRVIFANTPYNVLLIWLFSILYVSKDLIQSYQKFKEIVSLNKRDVVFEEVAM